MEKGRKTYCEKSNNAASKKPSENTIAGNEPPRRSTGGSVTRKRGIEEVHCGG